MTGQLAAIALALLLDYPSQTTSGVLPDLSIGFNPPEGPGYDVAPDCVIGKPLITFLLVVTNVGSLNSQPIPVASALTIADVDDPWWSIGSPLGAIAAGHNQALTLRLPGEPGMYGTHDFRISINTTGWFEEYSLSNNTTTVSIKLPPCPKG
ncbi:MAG: hypothetical protein JO293_04290 [Candidatus Eremiobacteraeota bacterium]|nr:hypothetical protein [Candidatus Eremiobacteraeota bacterium]